MLLLLFFFFFIIPLPSLCPAPLPHPPLPHPPTEPGIADMPVLGYNPFRALLLQPPGNWRWSLNQHREDKGGREGSEGGRRGGGDPS